MDFIDLKTQQKRIREKIDERIRTVLSHGQYIMGPEVKELEDKLAQFVGVKHAIGCASGTDALLLSLMAFQIGPGDAVFTTPFTFVATAEAIALLGATPIFVDIDPVTYNIDPVHLEAAIAAVSQKNRKIYPLPRNCNVSQLSARAVVVVDLFGLPAYYHQIEPLARKEGLVLIEDAAQSFGAECFGRKACSFGHIACTSFFPAKPLGGYGDGGMCFTDDDHLVHILRSLRVHGQGTDRYEHIRLGINARLDTLQAAILLAKFEIFPEEIEMRQMVAARYLASLAGSRLTLPHIPAHFKSAWAQFSVLAENSSHRREIQDYLASQGIPTAIHYPLPLHLQAAFSYLGYERGDFPVAEDVATRIFSLPMHPYLTDAEQKKIGTAPIFY
ncbi:MAG: DegT/DnrJ/EryC1/StrS family aminotransferase [Syntrophales bacterium]|nr:DegT/DnrJ/EryC1/StrS family aminotransferase [Syntrophales bacterium]